MSNENISGSPMSANQTQTPANKKVFFALAASKIEQDARGVRTPAKNYGEIKCFMEPSDYKGKSIEEIVGEIERRALDGEIKGSNQVRLKYSIIATSMGELRNSILSNRVLGGDGHIEYRLFGENIDPNAIFDVDKNHEKNGIKIPFAKLEQGELSVVSSAKFYYYSTSIHITFVEYGG